MITTVDENATIIIYLITTSIDPFVIMYGFDNFCNKYNDLSLSKNFTILKNEFFSFSIK